MRILAAIVVLAVAWPTTARGQAMITDRNYAIELYDGVALGSTSLIGMGGAGAAHLVGTSGTLINPAAMATRSTTDTDSWNWDVHLDYLNAGLSDDYDNNGQDDSGSQLGSFGAGGRYHDWTLSIAVTFQSLEVDADDGPDADDVGDELLFQTVRARAVLGKWFPDRDIALGLGLNLVSLTGDNTSGVVNDESNPADLFEIAGGGLVAGITYVPRLQSWRLAAALETPILGADVKGDECIETSCAGFILPTKIVAPARGVIGAAYRIADTEWNQLVGGTFRDERSVTLATDLVVTGRSSGAYGVQAFSQKMLQRSGEDVAVSLRAGAEVELLPGRLRTRAGSYWEPGRFEGVSGRIHGTFGLDIRVLEVAITNYGRHRGRISLTGDIARDYRNVAVSVGFWH